MRSSASALRFCSSKGVFGVAATGRGALFLANANGRELDVAFPTGFDRLALMKSMAYAYGWRFTFRINRQRGAVV
jgi:hypothetical protein